MKKLFLLVVLILPIKGFGQQKPAERKKPTYYLDSVAIDMEKVYINPNNLKDVSVVKNNSGGEIYLSTKEGLKFITLEQILKEELKIVKPGHVLYVVNNKVVLDVNVLIDSSYIKDVSFTNLSETAYIDKKFKGLIVVQINLLTGKEKKEIMIRGSELSSR